MQLSLIIEEVRALFHRVYKLFSSTIFQVVNLAYDTDIVKVLVGFSLTRNILEKCQDVGKTDQHFHYISVIGKINYLENSTRK